MFRGELLPAAVAVAGAAILAVGGLFYSDRFDGTAILHQEAAYAAAIVDTQHPLVVSFSSGGSLVRRKIADPARKYLAVYDSAGHLLRWERGDVFYVRSASGYCFQRMTGQDYVGRLYLPSLPLRHVRNVHVTQHGDSLTISWQSPAGRTNRWRSNVLHASYSDTRLRSYRYSGASAGLTYPTGLYTLSYPRHVAVAAAPSPKSVCAPATQRLPAS